MKILYVEDDEDSALMLEQRLEKKGYTVILARDGEEGVILAQKEKPDLILLDLGMPVMNGWDAARYLKTFPNTAKTPIIALSCHAMLSSKQKALISGCSHFHSKPVDFLQLLSEIEILTHETIDGR